MTRPWFLALSAVGVLTLTVNAAAQLCANGVTCVDIARDDTDKDNEDDAEPSIAVNPLDPKMIRIVTFSGKWRVRKPKKINATVWVTNDGGLSPASWSKEEILPSPDEHSTKRGDQKIVFDASGTLHLVELAKGKLTPRCYFYEPGSSTDFVFGSAFGNDQPQIASRDTEPKILAAWVDIFKTRLKNRSFVTVATNTNKGVELQDIPVGPYKVDCRTTRIAVAPSGDTYVIYKVHNASVFGTPFDNAVFFVAHSKDGVTWVPPGVPIHKGDAITWFTDRWGDDQNGGKVGRAMSSDAWIATNPKTGEVWAVYCNAVNKIGQIWATHSANNGADWAPPVQVTDGSRNSAFPEVAVAENGAIAVLYIDYDNSGARTVYTHRIARSFTSGLTWSDTKLQDLTTQGLKSGPNGKDDGGVDTFLWGDYEGLTAVGDTFYGVFCGKSDTTRSVPQFDPIFFKMSATP